MKLNDESPSPTQQEQYIAIWTKTIETQMHFNEMSAKSRQIGLAFVAAALGLSVVLLARNEDFSIRVWSVQIHVSVLILAAALVALRAVRLLDLGVYHKMLRGAVAFGEDFEENYMKKVFSLEKGLTQAVSHFSRATSPKATAGDDGRLRYTDEQRTHTTAEAKISRFYQLSTNALIVSAIALLVVTNLAPPVESPRAISRDLPVSDTSQAIISNRDQTEQLPDEAVSKPSPSISPTVSTDSISTADHPKPNEEPNSQSIEDDVRIDEQPTPKPSAGTSKSP